MKSCGFCILKFATEGLLESHVASIHSDMLISCDFCGIRLENGVCINEHKRIHEASPWISCLHCTANFENDAHLRNHVTNMHEALFLFSESEHFNLEETPEEIHM